MAWDNEKKKVKTAVAVAYEPGDKAPKILASGRGEVAEKIIAKAKENDVPFYKDNKLAETLSKLEIGDAIPPELYEVVAEILVFVDEGKIAAGRYVIINEVKLQQMNGIIK